MNALSSVVYYPLLSMYDSNLYKTFRKKYLDRNMKRWSSRPSISNLQADVEYTAADLLYRPTIESDSKVISI